MTALTWKGEVYGLRNRFVGIAVLAALVSGAVACSEDLNGTAGCPSLCPEQRVNMLTDALATTSS